MNEYLLRLARIDELHLLTEIEDTAGKMFSGLNVFDEARATNYPTHLLAERIEAGHVWVACTLDDTPVGAITVSVAARSVHVEELDVLPAHGRRGLGTRLLERVCSWARDCGLTQVTLSTFRDIPWNGPFYRKFGFRYLSPHEWSPRMHAIRFAESQHGLDIEARAFMQLELG